jgi:4-amino-4-deoxy-L-arabinose transferase-like glycosyltransferase
MIPSSVSEPANLQTAPPRKSASILRYVTALTALGIGLKGQSMLGDGRGFGGALLLGIAALVFLVVFWKQPGTTVQPGAVSEVSLPRSKKLLFLAPVFLSALAFWLFDSPSLRVLAWLLYLAGMGLLVFAAFKLDPPRLLDGRRKGLSWLEASVLIFILAVAAFMRLYRFDEIPFGLWHDEAENGLSALRILNEGHLPLFENTLPAHFLYLIAFLFRVLGVSTLSLRTVSVLFGLATTLVAFLLGSELFNRRLGLVLAFFLAVSRWDVNWSRIAMQGATVPFFEMISAFWVLRALRTQRLPYYALAGLSLGLGFCFYTPLFVFPLVVGAFLLYSFISGGKFPLSRMGTSLLVLGILLASVPVFQVAVLHPDVFFDRMGTLFIFSGKSAGEGLAGLSRTVPDHLLMFNYRGDQNGRHNLPGEPMLDSLSGTLLVLGAALSLRRIRQPVSFLLLAWLLVMLLPGIFSLAFESPQSFRAIGSLPAACLLAAVPIHALWKEWENLSAKPCHAMFLLPLLLFLATMGAMNYYIYFDLQARRSSVWSVFSTPETLIGSQMSDWDGESDVYLTGYFHDAPTIRFLAPNLKEYRLLDADVPVLPPQKGEKPRVFFMDPYNRSIFFEARKRNDPHAVFTEHRAPNGETILYQIVLEP